MWAAAPQVLNSNFGATGGQLISISARNVNAEGGLRVHRQHRQLAHVHRHSEQPDPRPLPPNLHVYPQLSRPADGRAQHELRR